MKVRRWWETHMNSIITPIYSQMRITLLTPTICYSLKLNFWNDNILIIDREILQLIRCHAPTPRFSSFCGYIPRGTRSSGFCNINFAQFQNECVLRVGCTNASQNICATRRTTTRTNHCRNAFHPRKHDQNYANIWYTHTSDIPRTKPRIYNCDQREPLL